MGLMASVDPELLVFVMLYCSGKEVRSTVIAALSLSSRFWFGFDSSRYPLTPMARCMVGSVSLSLTLCLPDLLISVCYLFVASFNCNQC